MLVYKFHKYERFAIEYIQVCRTGVNVSLIRIKL